MQKNKILPNGTKLCLNCEAPIGNVRDPDKTERRKACARVYCGLCAPWKNKQDKDLWRSDNKKQWKTVAQELQEKNDLLKSENALLREQLNDLENGSAKARNDALGVEMLRQRKRINELERVVKMLCEICVHGKKELCKFEPYEDATEWLKEATQKCETFEKRTEETFFIHESGKVICGICGAAFDAEKLAQYKDKLGRPRELIRCFKCGRRVPKDE